MLSWIHANLTFGFDGSHLLAKNIVTFEFYILILKVTKKTVNYLLRIKARSVWLLWDDKEKLR